MSLTFTILPVKGTPCPYFINDDIPVASCLRPYQEWKYVYYTSGVYDMPSLLLSTIVHPLAPIPRQTSVINHSTFP